VTASVLVMINVHACEQAAEVVRLSALMHARVAGSSASSTDYGSKLALPAITGSAPHWPAELERACLHGDLPMLNQALRHGVDVESALSDGWSACALASAGGLVLVLRCAGVSIVCVRLHLD
jgi:hypothetical protein